MRMNNGFSLAAKLIRLGLLLSFAWRGYSYVDGTVLQLDSGAKTVIWHNAGPRGDISAFLNGVAVSLPYTQIVPAGSTVWASIAGFPEQSSTVACPNPCSQSIDMEYGQPKIWYDDAGKKSVRLYLPFVRQLCETAPFTVPAMVHGFENYETCKTFSVAGGTGVSNLRLWMWVSNWRNDAFIALINGNEHRLATTPVVSLTCDGSACTGSTGVNWHGMIAGKQAQLNGYGDLITPAPTGQLNGLVTIATVPSLTTFTFASSIAAGNYNIDGGFNVTTGLNRGQTVSQSVFYADETRFFLGMDGWQRAFQMLVPLGPTEVIAGTNNTAGFRYKGAPQGSATGPGVHGGWLLDWNIVQSDVELDSIVVTGLNAKANATAHGFLVGETLLLRDAPGPRWRFNGKRVITAKTANDLTFLWGSDLAGETPGVYPYITVNAVYTVPVPQNRTLQGGGTFVAATVWPPPKMYAARCLIPYSDYQYYDPSTFASSPIVTGGNAANGAILFTTKTLKDRNSYFKDHSSLAKCSDCHTNNATATYKAGWDLKYGGWDPYVILVATLGRNGSVQDGKDIAAHVISIPITTPAKGRPWNPMNQPAVGQDSLGITQWLAGGGLEWTLTYDSDSKEWMAPGGSYASWAPGTGTFNMRELPVMIQMPTWMQILPTVHPKDFYNSALGQDFTTKPMWTTYQGYLANSVSGTFSSITSQNYLNDLVVQKYAADLLLIIRNQPGGSQGAGAYAYPAQYGTMVQSALTHWVTSRYIEIFHGFSLENFLDQTYVAAHGAPNARAAPMYSRGLYGQWAFNTAYHKSVGVTVGGLSNFGAYNTAMNSVVNFDTDSASMYHWQLVLDAGNRFLSGNFETDRPYLYVFAGNHGKQRPNLWMYNAATASGFQNAWGWDNLSSLQSGPATSALLRFPLGFRNVDGFSTETEKAEHTNQSALQLLAAANAWSVGEWQATLASDCPLSHTPSAAAGRAGGCISDGLATGFPIYGHYSVANGYPTGVAAATITALTSFFNSVFAASGHDFTVDFVAGCEYVLSGGQPPPELFCTTY